MEEGSAYEHGTRCNLDSGAWRAGDVDARTDVLCKVRASILEQQHGPRPCTFRCTLFALCSNWRRYQPIKQPTYPPSLVLAANIQTYINMLLLAENLPRSYSDCIIPLVVLGEAKGPIRLTVDCARHNDQTIVAVAPPPTIDDLLDKLGGSNVLLP